VFLDSTVARFWFLRPRARGRVLDRLEELKGGRWLTAEDKKELHLDGAPRENGEEFWLLEPGSVIIPSYFQRVDPPKGMHGYHPSVRENWGALLTSTPVSIKTEAVSLVRVFDTALGLLGIEV